MGLIVTILLGALVGYLAAHLMGRREGFLVSVLIGIVGAFLGNVVSHLLGVGDQSGLVLDWSNLLWALGGSILVVVILNAIQHRPNHPSL
jgi:uncharacterized membrane protein YeaQ/YmgE (transglycosylase-associated protein family)